MSSSKGDDDGTSGGGGGGGSHAATKILLEFLVPDSNPAENVKEQLLPILEKYVNTNLKLQTKIGTKTTLQLFSSDDEDVTVTLRSHARPKKEILFTIDIDFCTENKSVYVRTAEDVKKLTADINAAIQPLLPNWQQMPPLKLGHRFNQYGTTFDGRIIEYNFKQSLLDIQSSFQRVEIIETVDHGRMLVLDSDKNLSEADTVSYTHTLMGLPETKEVYAGSDVLILGGGDGALLKELLELEKPPAFVSMIDIDEVVLNTCSKYLPTICGPYIGQREGSNFKVNIGDAIAFMKNCKEASKQFDVIFSDLTTIPIEETKKEDYAFLCGILELALGLLRPKGGRLMTHCMAKSRPDVLERFEATIRSFHGGSVDFKRREAFVPAFMEVWVYYEMFFKSSS